MKRWYVLVLTIPLFALLWLNQTPNEPPPPPPPPPPIPIEKQSLSFGVVPQFGTKHLAEVWEPLIRQLELATGLTIRVTPSPSIPAFEASFSNGEFDFAYMNPYHYLCAKRDEGYEPLIRDQSKKLKGILVVHADAEIQTIDDLNGKKIAFPAPNALGASLYMRALLKRTHGIEFEPLYVNSHDSVYLNVVTKEVLAGGGVKRTLSSQTQEVQDQLNIIYETPGVAPHPIVYHPRVSSGDVELIRTAWLTLNDAIQGRLLLKQIPMANPGPASHDDYVPLEQIDLAEFYVAPVSAREEQ